MNRDLNQLPDQVQTTTLDSFHTRYEDRPNPDSKADLKPDLNQFQVWTSTNLNQF